MPKRTSKEAFSWELVEKQCRETHRPGYELGGEASRPGYELGGETSRPGYELGGKASRPGCELGSDQATVDVSLKTPVLNALTERTAIDASWEQCMIVAPVTIQLMGQLLIVASTKDVSFREFAPDRKFTYIRNPESLRATLLQVSHGKP
ncbi:unnamed protein product [Rotaria magnacalcarata]|uniref:Uncharacterized protein n=1 Tax=Rotaria magnacalcarata TaxID=392030 RepID=A0A8S3DKN6_9BILA|nr:unnamed protein product [Rotaria magnacalcarata]